MIPDAQETADGSPDRRWVGWVALVASVVLCSVAHLLLRDGAADGKGFELFLRWKVILGLVIYGCGTGLWLVCLSNLDLSVAFPASALQFIVVMAGARLILGEPLPLLRLIGGTIIIAGILLLVGEKTEGGRTGMIAAITSVLLIAGSQILFKSSMIRLRARHGKRIPPFSVLFYPRVILALAVNVIAALLWIWALRNLEISYVYPLLCLNFLLVPLGARQFLGEEIGRRRWVGVGVICAGVILCLAGK